MSGNLVTLQSKEEAAEELVQAHYALEAGMRLIVRLLADNEDDPREPLKLLEVNADTVEAGLQPIPFGSRVEHGVVHPPVTIIEVTPDEYERIKRKTLPLPNAWRLGRPYSRPAST